MRNASVEWMARVAARNEIETAKATSKLHDSAMKANATRKAKKEGGVK